MHIKTKTKTDADRKLIKEIFAVDPVSWARYPDGRLVFISPTGQKFGYTQEQFENIAEAVRQEKIAKKKLASKKSTSKSKKEIIPDTVPASEVDFGRRGG